MRVVSLLLIFSSLSAISAQEQKKKEQQKIPTTLAEAHAELERILSADVLAEIDAMPSQYDVSKYHFGLGMSIRNGWGLWAGGPLAKHMQELGFTHPDHMSSVILATFWCKRHGQDFRLEERAAGAKKSMEAEENAQEEEKIRVQEAKTAIRNMMMGLRFEKRDVPAVRVPAQSGGMSVRFMCPFRGGVFLTAYCQWPPRRGPVLSEGYYADPASSEARRRPEMDDSVVRGLYLGADRESHKMGPGDDFYTLGFYLDLKERKIHRVRVAEVNEIYAAVVAGERAWFAGLTDGKAVLVGVGDRDRITVPLPREDEIPDLGLDGQSLLAVYSKTIFCLADRNWTLLHSGDILLPRSGLPPQRHGNMVFLRDEQMRGSRRRLWWLTMGEQSRLHLLARDTGLFEPIVRSSPQWMEIRLMGPPDWDYTSSYCVTSSGDLWACVANGSFLLRRSKDGSYSIAIAYNSVEHTGDAPGAREADQDLRVSAVAALPDGTLLLAGTTGLYRLKGNELVQELAFTFAPRSYWYPSNILVLDDRSYVISTAWEDGVYLLRKGIEGQWNCLPVEKLRDTVVW